MKKKIVQINTVCNGSTGRIMNQIQKEAEKDGWEVYNFYGRGEPTNNNCHKITNKFQILSSVFLTRIFGKHGYACKQSTKRLIKQIEDINPDVIQLHNIHGYYLNIKNLFSYLKRCNKEIIWTLHDCWTFTGHCAHFTFQKCNNWKEQCGNCPQKGVYPKSYFFDNSKKEYQIKKELFTDIKNLTIVVPSVWLSDLVKHSFLNKYPVKVVSNGIDLGIFQPTKTIDVKEKYNIQKSKKIILGVATNWDNRKGLNDFIELAKYLSDDYIIVIVGLKKEQKKGLPNNIIGIERTENIEELANWYTISEVLFNSSKEESFSLVTIESMACGTPVIAYNNSAVKELIKVENKGLLLDVDTSLEINIKHIIDYLKDVQKIDRKLIEKYSVENMTKGYIQLYEDKM